MAYYRKSEICARASQRFAILHPIAQLFGLDDHQRHISRRFFFIFSKKSKLAILWRVWHPKTAPKKLPKFDHQSITQKIGNFNFIKKMKKRPRDIPFMNIQCENLRQRMQNGEMLREARALFDPILTKSGPNLTKKCFRFFFISINPKMLLYTKNEVFMAKTEKKTSMGGVSP